MLVALVDYGSGNLRSAAKAIERASRENDIAVRVSVTADPGEVRKADRVVLPGVGAFADCKAGLLAIPGMIEALEHVVFTNERPFLGICVGMQLLATLGYEHGKHAGLNWIDGNVVPLPVMRDHNARALRIPHMGWNEIKFKQGVHDVLTGLTPGTKMYFVHSYHFVPDNLEDRLATVPYGADLTAMVGRGNIVGTQFHPEKSQTAGLRLLANFLRWAP